jgi:hypothetical protein
VRGTTEGGQEWRETVVPDVRNNPAIAAAWARGHVRQLEDRYAACVGNRYLEKTIVATSLRFGVLCRFTAYVAVDRAAAVNPGGHVHKTMQPVELPAGWRDGLTGDGDRMMARYFLADDSLACAAPTGSMLGEVLDQVAAARTSEILPKLARGRGLHLRYRMSERASIQSDPPHSDWCSPPMPPSNPEELLRQEGFTLESEIEQDEHGTLYKAHDKGGKLVSIQVLAKPISIDGSAAFEALQKILQGLKHPAIAAVLRLIADPGAGLVIAEVREYVGGPSLSSRIGQSGLPDPREAARIVLAVAEALEYAVRRGLIHGNIRADNIRLGDDGTPRVTSFGLARLDFEPAATSVAHRAYVAPELREPGGARPSRQSNIYSLGVVLYVLFSGVEPDPDEGGVHPRSPRQINPHVPADLEAICMKAMAADTAVRYATAGKLAAALRTAIGSKRPGLLNSWRIFRS